MAREVIHKKPDTIWLFEYPSFEAMDGEKNRLVFLSEREMNLIWQSTNFIDRWQSRVFNSVEGELYQVVSDLEFEEFQGWVSDMRVSLEEFEMIEEILAEIRDAIMLVVTKPCCPSGTTTGSRGSGSSGRPPSTYDQTETPDTPPPGFSSMEDFTTRKCDAAEDILNNLKSDLIGLSGLTYSGSSPTGLVGAMILFFLTPIPFDDMVGLAAYLIYTAYSYTFLAEMSAKITENQDELRCIMYSASSAETAQTDLLSRLEEIALAYFATEGEATFVMGAVEHMLGYDAFNILFENVPTVSSGAECNCVACEGAEWSITYGDLSSGEPTDTTVTITSVLGPPVGGVARYWIVMGYTCDVCFRLTIASSGYSRGDLGGVHNIGNLVYLCSGGGTEYDLQMSNTPDDWSGECFWPASSGGFQFNSRTPFTVTVSLTEAPCE